MQKPDPEKDAGDEGQGDLHSEMSQLEQERKNPPQHGCERDEAAIDDEKPEHEVIPGAENQEKDTDSVPLRHREGVAGRLLKG